MALFMRSPSHSHDWSYAMILGGGLLAIIAVVFVLLFIHPAPDTTMDFCAAHACLIKPVQGHSMAPALEDGDSIRIGIDYYSFFAPARGDIVIIDFNIDPELRVKRVIGISGDAVAFDDEGVRVGGEVVIPSPIGEKFSRDAFVFSRYTDPSTPLMVPPGKVLVIGDNLAASVDSRHWGFIDQRFLSGKVLEVIPLISNAP